MTDSTRKAIVIPLCVVGSFITALAALSLNSGAENQSTMIVVLLAGVAMLAAGVIVSAASRSKSRGAEPPSGASAYKPPSAAGPYKPAARTGSPSASEPRPAASKLIRRTEPTSAAAPAKALPDADDDGRIKIRSLTWGRREDAEEEKELVYACAEPISRVSLDEKYAAESGGWICPYCETINPFYASSCESCGKKK